MSGNIPYAEAYPETLFQWWYAAGRPQLTKEVVSRMPKDHDGRSPNHGTVKQWMTKDKWRDRAAVLDAKALAVIDNDLVQKKVQVIREQLAEAEQIKASALKHLKGEFDTSAAAVSAYFKAAEQQRTAVGLAEYLQKVQTMNSSELTDTIRKLITRANEFDVIEGEEVSNEKETEE